MSYSSSVQKAAERVLFEDLKLTQQIITLNMIGVCEQGEYRNRIIFPSRDKSGKINFFTTRALYSDYKKYLDCEASKSSFVWNELFIDWSESVVIVEGVKSYLKHFSMGNIIPVLGKKIYKGLLLQNLVLNGCDVHIALDPEAQGAALESAERVKSYGLNASLVNLPKQPDEMDSDDFKECVSKSVSFDKDLLIFQKVSMI